MNAVEPKPYVLKQPPTTVAALASMRLSDHIGARKATATRSGTLCDHELEKDLAQALRWLAPELTQP